MLRSPQVTINKHRGTKQVVRGKNDEVHDIVNDIIGKFGVFQQSMTCGIGLSFDNGPDCGKGKS